MTLIIIAGLPGTGKTTFSTFLRNNLDNSKLICQNDIRRDFGMKKMTIRNGKEHQGNILRKIDRMVADSLSKNNNVILDAVHRFDLRRQQLYGIASGMGKGVLVIRCICSDEEAKKRMKKREKSDGLIVDAQKTSVYDRHKSQWEDISKAFDDASAMNHVSYITFNSETEEIQEKKIRPETKSLVDKIKKHLLNSGI